MAGGWVRLRGSPQDLLRQAEGRVWETTVPPGELARIRDRHLVSKMVRTDAGVRVRLLAPAAPAPGAVPAAPDLEDAYLTIIHAAPGTLGDTDTGTAQEARR
jgi:hypothetical protein